MIKQQKKLFLTIKSDFLICLGVIIFIFLASQLGLLEKLEHRTYDILLSVKPAVQENADLMIVAIDDAAIGEVGTFPWSRDILADALIRMRELGAAAAVFDIEYVSPSQKGIDPLVESSLPAVFSKSEKTLSGLMYDLSDAVSGGFLPPKYLPETVDDLVTAYVQPEFAELERTVVGNLSRDNDLYFAQAIHFFGNTWLTINAGDVGIKVSEELKNYTRDNVLLKNVKEPAGLIARENDAFLKKQGLSRKMTPSLLRLMQEARGAGFTNVVLDSDGVRRRIELLHETEGLYIPQLVFAPLLDILQTKSLERTKNSLIIKNALWPGETERRDAVIPLDQNGRMLVNWTSSVFKDGFKYESVLFLYDIDKKEQAIIEILRKLASFQLASKGKMLSYYETANYLLRSYEDIRLLKKNLIEDLSIPNSRQDSRYEEYFQRRSVFFEECVQLADPLHEQKILQTLAEILTDENRTEIEEIQFFVSDKFEKYREYLSGYTGLFKDLKDRYNNAFCIVGHTASNSTDLGTTPFEGQYPNIGTHVNIFNTIMNRAFIKPIPRYIAAGIAAFAVLLLSLFSQTISVKLMNISSIGIIILVPIITVLLMRAGIYTPLIMPFFIVAFSYVALSLYRFAKAEKDKTFLRRAFSTYLSEDVVEEIVNDPSKLSLGGAEKNITALFTDIKGFSTLSEKVTPVQLVAILNEYLTELSNIVLEHKGTIDKYIGDAIVAFFGAPISLEDHAWRACLSAIRMKDAESKLNEKFAKDGFLPMPILTRIGINTGNMVVGNMGTDMKMNYTIMGNDVNLAARLEGVNKSYDSWILISESAWTAADSGVNAGKLLARRLDRVRVVGIHTPVQLYNIVGLKAELAAELHECVNTFHAGLDKYLKKDFSGAKKLFDDAARIWPDDGPSRVFSKRCSEFMQTGIPSDWDGILNMTSK